ncbi:MAG: IPT/TIG domain-containing protein [bacterium]
MKNTVTRTKLNRVLVGLILALLLPLAGCGKSSPTAGQSGSEVKAALPAVVVDAGTKKPVPGAVAVSFEGEKTRVSPEGNVLVEVPARSPFLFTVSAPGYQETLVGGKLPDGKVENPVEIPLAKAHSSSPPIIVTVGGAGSSLVRMPEMPAGKTSIVNGQWNHLSFPKSNITRFTITGLTAGFALSYFDAVTSHSWKYVIVNANGTIASGNDLLDPSHGYWLQGYSGGTVEAVGDIVAAANMTLPLGGTYGSVGQQWNLVGCPYSLSIPLSTIRIRYNGTEYTLANASSNNITGPAFSHFEASTGKWEYALGSGNLDPNKGYWFLVFKDSSLILPNPTPTPTAPPAPVITSLSPTSGDVGTPITISGSNFGDSQGSSTVLFTDGASAGQATSWSAGNIVVNVPAGAVTGSVTVTVGGVTSNAFNFTVTAKNWIRQNPLPTGYPLDGVWGAANNDVYAVGQNGTVLHYDGSWSIMSSGTTSTLRGIWGASSSSIFAVGLNGAIIRYNGSAWSPMSSGITTALSGVWGAAANDVFAVGDSGKIRYYNGTAWSLSDSGTTQNLRGIWGTGNTYIFAVGDGGTIIQWNGANWAAANSGVTQNLKAVWGAANNDVYAVGDGGTILHYAGAGNAWSTMTSNTTQNLKSVWGAANNNVYAMGDNGTIMHYDGTTWSTVSSSARELPNTTEPLNGIWGSSATSIFAVGGSYNNGFHSVILKYDGTSWASMSSGVTSEIYGGWCYTGSDAFAVGSNGTVIHYNGTSWGGAANSGTTAKLNAVYGIIDSTSVYAVGDSGTIIHYNGISWGAANSGTTANLYGVWGNVNTNVYAVGDSGIVLHYNGTWSAMTTMTTARLNAIWGGGSNDIFVVGGSADWTSQTNYGVILHYDGSLHSGTYWPKVLTRNDCFFQGVWGSSSNDVYAVGAYYQFYGSQSVTSYSKIFHYDGTAWSEMSLPNVGFLSGVWGSGANNVFAVGNGGAILRYNGSTWNQVISGTTNPLFCVWGAGTTDYFSGGSGGTILHY